MTTVIQHLVAAFTSAELIPPAVVGTAIAAQLARCAKVDYDTHYITYRPCEEAAEQILNEAMDEYKELMGMSAMVDAKSEYLLRLLKDALIIALAKHERFDLFNCLYLR